MESMKSRQCLIVMFGPALLFVSLSFVAACSPASLDEQSELAQYSLSASQTVVSLNFDDGSADQLQAADLLSAHGMRGTFFIISDRLATPGSLSVAELLAMQDAGHEIGGHTMGHVDLLTVDDAARLRQLCQSRYDLIAAGLAVANFAYPFGSPVRDSPELPIIEAMLRACGYNSARGSGDLHTETSCNTCPVSEKLPPTDVYHLKSISSIKSTVTIETLKNYVRLAEQAGTGWLPLVLHRVCDGCSDNAISPGLLGEFLDWLSGEVATNRVSVKTTAEVIGGELQPAVPAPPRPQPVPGANLLPNPSLEIDMNHDKIPDCWQRAGSGTSTGSYSLTSVAHSGSVAQQIDVTDYSSGGRRIVVTEDATNCAPLAIPAHVYQVSAWYTATGPSRFSAFVLDASNKWGYFAQSPLLSPVDTYTQASWTIPALPAGTRAVTVGLTLVANGRLRMDDFDLHDTDRTPPLVAFVHPADGGVIRGTVAVVAAASDAGGVGGVELLVDGRSVGPLTAASDGNFTVDWDSTLYSDGSVSLQARAWDAAGNPTTSTIPVTITNAPNPNLLPNPSLESDQNRDQIPDCWHRGGSGTSTAVYSLTSNAHSGTVAQQIDVTGFVSGARRLVVSQDPVCSPRAEPGHVYEVSAWYEATSSPRFTAYVLDASGSWVYLAQSTLLSPTDHYTQASWEAPAVPAGTRALSVGLALVANGQLRMDDFELHDKGDVVPPALSFVRPVDGMVARGTVPVVVVASDGGGIDKVELLVDGSQLGAMTASADGSFSLGWDSTIHADGPAILKVRAWDTVGNMATATVNLTVANPAGANLMPNPSLELDLNQDQVPDCWYRGGSGTSTATYTLTSIAHSGGVAQQIDVTDFINGARRLVVKQDAGLCSPRVTPGHIYEVSAWYQANASSRFTAYVLDADNNWIYLAQSPLLSLAENYTRASWLIPAVPAGSRAISVGLTLVANGRLRMDDFDLHDTGS